MLSHGGGWSGHHIYTILDVRFGGWGWLKGRYVGVECLFSSSIIFNKLVLPYYCIYMREGWRGVMKIVMIILIRVDEKKACNSGNCWMRLTES